MKSRFEVFTVLDYFQHISTQSRTRNHKVFDDKTEKLITNVSPSRGYSLFRLSFEYGERVAAHTETISVEWIR